MEFIAEDIIKVLLAILIGGLIGAEREHHDKAAGFRTIILICVGAAIFTILSVKIAGDRDPARIAANIVTGIGFLGAGVIMRERGRVTGLTTAATIWLTASIGMAIGGGYYVLSSMVTAIMLIVLWLFPVIEARIETEKCRRTYEILSFISEDKFTWLQNNAKDLGLEIKSCSVVKSGEGLTCSMEAIGSHKSHDRLMLKIVSDPEIREFKF